MTGIRCPYGPANLIAVSTSLLAIACCVQRTEGTSVSLWPEGTYGLPMAATSLCPSSVNFTWATGSRNQDTVGANQRSTNFHLATSVKNNSVEQRFCVKDVDADSVSLPSWPDGRYCVYKKGASCPFGLSEGWVFWDDKNEANKNTVQGTLPDGMYNQDTKIYFCCQTVGSVFDTIYLPVDKPFYLIAFKSYFSPNPACQEVHGAVATVDYVKFGVENSSSPNMGGVFPFGADAKPEPYIYYCYYSACKHQLSSLSGSLTSPMYPGEYRDNIDCTWTITRQQNYTIQLSFSVFELEPSKYCSGSTCPCDYVDIMESNPENGAEVLIGRYCNKSVLPAVVTSTADHLFVHFHSDTSVGGKGFQANYKMGLQGQSSTTPQPSVTATTLTTERSNTDAIRSNNTATDTPELLKSVPIEVALAVAIYSAVVVIFVGVTLCCITRHGGSAGFQLSTNPSMKKLSAYEVNYENALDIEIERTKHTETKLYEHNDRVQTDMQL